MDKKVENTQATKDTGLNIDGVSVLLSNQDVKDLKQIRNYFGEQDKTLFEHWAYSFLDRLLMRTIN